MNNEAQVLKLRSPFYSEDLSVVTNSYPVSTQHEGGGSYTSPLGMNDN